MTRPELAPPRSMIPHPAFGGGLSLKEIDDLLRERGVVDLPEPDPRRGGTQCLDKRLRFVDGELVEEEE